MYYMNIILKEARYVNIEILSLVQKFQKIYWILFAGTFGGSNSQFDWNNYQILLVMSTLKY